MTTGMQKTPDQHHLPRTFPRTSQFLGDTPGNVTDWGFRLLGDLGLKTMWKFVASMSQAPWSSQSQTRGYQPCGTRVASWNVSNLREFIQVIFLGGRVGKPFPMCETVVMIRMELNFPHLLSILPLIPDEFPRWSLPRWRHFSATPGFWPNDEWIKRNAFEVAILTLLPTLRQRCPFPIQNALVSFESLGFETLKAMKTSDKKLKHQPVHTTN